MFDSSEELFRSLAAHTPVGVFVSGVGGGCTFVNERWCELAGLRPEQALGDGWMVALHPDDRERVLAQWAGASSAGHDSVVEYRFLHSDGTVRWIQGFAAAHRADDGRIVGWVGTCLDLTERREAEATAAEVGERFRVAFENAPIGVALLAPDGYWLQVNSALCDLLGYTSDELLGLTFADITHPDDLAGNLERSRKQLEGEEWERRIEKRYVRSDGDVVWVSLTNEVVSDADGEPLYFVAQIEDITERKRAREELERLASDDPLTGLLNRRRFDEELQRELKRLRREPGRQAALLLLDVDRFKLVNDSLGHRAGDDVLCAVAQTLTHRLRETDVIARLGGDEFAALLLDLHGADDARQIASELTTAIGSQSILTVGGAASVTVSIGVVTLDHTAGERDIDALVAADDAMYRAKRAGRNRISLAA